MRTKRAAIAPSGRTNLAERQGLEPWTPLKVRLFSRQYPRPTGRAPCEMAPPLGIAPSSHRLTGGPHTLCVERNWRWSGTPVLPRVSPRPKLGGLLSSSCPRMVESGGLCGHCSRDLPLDRRLLFVAELTGHEMVRRPGNAPDRPRRAPVLQTGSRLWRTTAA